MSFINFLTLLGSSVFLVSCSSISYVKSSFNPNTQNKVFVLGVPHLRYLKFNDPTTAIKPVMAKLKNWSPDVICVESRHPDEVEVMISRKVHFEPYQKLFSSFHKKDYEVGIRVKKSLGLSSSKIEKEIQLLVSQNTYTKNPERLIQLYLADFDRINAYYIWYKSSDLFKRKNTLPKEVVALFEGYEESNDEIFKIAIPLAKSLNLRSICSMDSHKDATKVMGSKSSQLFNELAKDSNRMNFSKSPLSKKTNKLKKIYSESNDLLSLLKHYNSNTWLTHSNSQWDWERVSSKKIARVHYKGWELRNKRMSSNILEASHKLESKKILVIVGASHVYPLKREFKPIDSFNVVRFEDAFE